MDRRISLFQGDITTVDTEAIVNAANRSLLGGGGVDGAIHRAAGPQLLRECKSLGGCETGEAKITKGYNLRANYVIHTVGPVWHGGAHREAELLRRCYLSSLTLAEARSIRSLAFPSISTGAYGYPKEEAAVIALSTVSSFLPNSSLGRVLFVVFSDEQYALYSRLMKRDL